MQRGDRGAGADVDSGGAGAGDVACGVIGAFQQAFVFAHTEWIVAAMARDAAGLGFAFQNGHAFDSKFTQAGGKGQAGGAAADDGYGAAGHLQSSAKGGLRRPSVSSDKGPVQ